MTRLGSIGEPSKPSFPGTRTRREPHDEGRRRMKKKVILMMLLSMALTASMGLAVGWEIEPNGLAQEDRLAVGWEIEPNGQRLG